jgi:hypothetical protein
MTRVSLESAVGITMLCRGLTSVRLLVQNDTSSPTWDGYCETSTRERDGTVRVHFPLNQGERIKAAWVQILRCFPHEVSYPLLKVRLLPKRDPQQT